MKTRIKISIIAIAILSYLTSCGSGGNGENVLETIKLFPVKMGNEHEYCYVDKTGKVAIEGNYNYASLFYEGIAAVYASSREVRYINEKGEFITPDVYAKGTPFSEGIAFVQIGTRICDGNIVTAINSKGEQLFKLNTDETGIFREGLAAFRSAENGKCGYINRKGEMVLKCDYSDFNSPFMGDIAIVGGRNYCFINKKGERVSETFNDIGDLKNLGHAANSDRRYMSYDW